MNKFLCLQFKLYLEDILCGGGTGTGTPDRLNTFLAQLYTSVSLQFNVFRTCSNQSSLGIIKSNLDFAYSSLDAGISTANLIPLFARNSVSHKHMNN